METLKVVILILAMLVVGLIMSRRGIMLLVEAFKNWKSK